MENFEPLFHSFDVDFGEILEINNFMILITPSVSNYRSLVYQPVLPHGLIRINIKIKLTIITIYITPFFIY